jgi:hypothetical protein
MADLAHLDLKTIGGELRVRALLEDLVDFSRRGHGSAYPWALAVWFGKSPRSIEHNILGLVTGFPMDGINEFKKRISLGWLAGSDEPPYANIYTTSVDHFQKLVKLGSPSVEQYRRNYDVLYFDKELLTLEILQFFNVVTEPSGLIKGWYLSEAAYGEVLAGRYSLRSMEQTKPQLGLVKVEESPDFENCRGLVNVEVSERWVPLSPGALGTYTFYNDLQDRRPGYFLFQGGSLYRLLKIELKTAPEYSARLLEKLRDDRYPEVYLRAVHAPTSIIRSLTSFPTT